MNFELITSDDFADEFIEDFRVKLCSLDGENLNMSKKHWIVEGIGKEPTREAQNEKKILVTELLL